MSGLQLESHGFELGEKILSVGELGKIHACRVRAWIGEKFENEASSMVVECRLHN